MSDATDQLLADLHFDGRIEPWESNPWVDRLKGPDAARDIGSWRALALHNWVVELDIARAIALHATQLEQLVLGGTGFEAGALDALLAIPAGRPLTRLALQRCDLERDEWARLAGSALAARLRSLAVHDAEDAALGRMLGGDRRALRTLSIFGELGPVAGEAIAFGGALMGEIRALSIGASSIDPLARAALGRWDLPRLEVLELERLPLADRIVTELADAPLILSARCLELGRAKIGTEAIEALASRALPRLRELTLGGLTDRGASAIARAPWIEALESLCLVHCRASERGLAVLRSVIPEDRLDVYAR